MLEKERTVQIVRNLLMWSISGKTYKYDKQWISRVILWRQVHFSKQ